MSTLGVRLLSTVSGRIIPAENVSTIVPRSSFQHGHERGKFLTCYLHEVIYIRTINSCISEITQYELFVQDAKKWTERTVNDDERRY